VVRHASATPLPVHLVHQLPLPLHHLNYPSPWPGSPENAAAVLELKGVAEKPTPKAAAEEEKDATNATPGCPHDDAALPRRHRPPLSNAGES
jgi:hypothetical protein